MHIRALVQVHEHRKTHYNQGETEVIMGCVHAGHNIPEIPEAQRFAKATPSGRVTLLMVNSVAEQFKLGAYLYVDFTEAPTE